MVAHSKPSYASDAEVASLARTGFIISPDWSLSDEVNLGGTGGALLEDPEGWAIGAKLGYDQQIGDVVVGVITDAFYSFADGGGRGAGAGRFKSDLNYYGTVRGRLGYSFGRLMAYGTAGYAYGGLEVKDVTTGAKSDRGAERLDLRRRPRILLEPRPQPARSAIAASISTTRASRCLPAAEHAVARDGHHRFRPDDPLLSERL